MRRQVQSPQRAMRVMALKLTGSGTAALGEGSTMATLVDNGTGDWTLTWVQPFARAPIVVAVTMTTDSIVQVSAVSTTACTIKGFAANDGTTAKDIIAQIIVIGADVADAI